MNSKFIALSALFALTFVGTPAAWGKSGAHTMVTPNDLKWTDVASLPPGAKLAVIEGPLNEAGPIIFRIKFPGKYQIAPHWHPGVEHVTVISGTFHMGVGDKFDRSKSMALTAGSVGIMQPKTVHYAWTDSDTVVQVHGIGPWGITYVNPKDDPRAKK